MFRWAKKHCHWYYVGHLPIWRSTPSSGEFFPIAFFITESGRRRAELIGPRPSKHLNAHEYLRIAEIGVKLWKIGGPFPKGFIAEEDTLGEMLSRMIDARILGEKK